MINFAYKPYNKQRQVSKKEYNRHYNKEVAVNDPSPETISSTNIKNESSTMTVTLTIFASLLTNFIIVKIITIIGAYLAVAMTKNVALAVVFASLVGAFNAFLVVAVKNLCLCRF